MDLEEQMAATGAEFDIEVTNQVRALSQKIYIIKTKVVQVYNESPELFKP